MKHELIEQVATRLGRARKVRPNWMREMFPGQSAEDVADLLIRIAGEIEIAETRVW